MGLVQDLHARLGSHLVQTDRDVVASYSRDQSQLTPAGVPAAVVHAAARADVERTLRTAAEHGVPVVTRGAGSGLSGGANAVEGCVVLSLARMKRIVAVDADLRIAVVEPGVLTGDLKTAAEAVGLAYPPDPASAAFSTVGGNVATNAGGLCCVKYGVTRDYVLALEVVLPDGNVIRTGQRTTKGVAGYDLTSLLVGSEGTLGVITEITVRLVSPGAAPSTVVASFGDLAAAGAGLAEMRRTGITPSMLEVMDQPTICAVDDWKRMGLDRDAAALLIAESDSVAPRASDEVDALAEACARAGAVDVLRTDDAWERDQLLMARRLAYPALERLGAALLDDVCVPLDRIPDLLACTSSAAIEFDLRIAVFGHAGDGNLHPTIIYDAAEAASRQRAEAAFAAIIETTLALGGTITGEHGVGLLKRAFLTQEQGTTLVRLQRAIKQTFDPHSLLNPGKMLPVVHR